MPNTSLRRKGNSAESRRQETSPLKNNGIAEYENGIADYKSGPAAEFSENEYNYE